MSELGMIKGILTSSLKPSSIDESANNGLSLLFFWAESLYFNISYQFCNKEPSANLEVLSRAKLTPK